MQTDFGFVIIDSKDKFSSSIPISFNQMVLSLIFWDFLINPIYFISNFMVTRKCKMLH